MERETNTFSGRSLPVANLVHVNGMAANNFGGVTRRFVHFSGIEINYLSEWFTKLSDAFRLFWRKYPTLPTFGGFAYLSLMLLGQFSPAPLSFGRRFLVDYDLGFRKGLYPESFAIKSRILGAFFEDGEFDARNSEAIDFGFHFNKVTRFSSKHRKMLAASSTKMFSGTNVGETRSSNRVDEHVVFNIISMLGAQRGSYRIHV